MSETSSARPGDGDLRTTALLQLTAAIETATTLDELLMLGLNEFTHLLEISDGGVILLDEAGTTAGLVSTIPLRTSLPPAFLITETTFLWRVVANREAMQVDDVALAMGAADAAAATRQILPLLNAEQIRSLLFLPLVAQDRVIGVLVFGNRTVPRQFDEHEVAQARLMAGQFAAAITSFRIAEEALRRTAELATLNEIANTVTSSLNSREIYHLVMEKINTYFCVDAGSLLMLDEESNDLVFVMTLEAGEEKLFGVRVPYGHGIVWSVASSQHYAVVNDAQADPRFFREVSDALGYTVQTILCVPMVVKGRTIGVIELLNKLEGPFTEEEANRLTRMAATIGIALENARLFQTVTTVRDRFEAILNSTNDGILMVDMRGIIMTANPRAAQLLDRHRNQLINHTLDQVLHDLRSRAVSVSLSSRLPHEATSEGLEFELPALQGRFLRHYMLPVRETNGTEIGQLALFQDISQERALDQLREDYVGMLVHDLRAPLTAIINGILMVQRGLGGPTTEQQQELLSIAHEGSQTMLAMINTLLDISRMEQGHMNLNREPLSPYAVIDQALDRLRVSAQSQNIQLKQDFRAGLPLIEADREKLVRILQNLLDNAIKFSPSGGEVILGAGVMPTASREDQGILPLDVRMPDLETGEHLIFWVRDQGPGIAAQYHARIFDKFGQAHHGQRMRGSGLGLTFCKLAVEAHGGQIWLHSSEGHGSTFALALPVSA
ncbi:GAF domain-containing protein [Candidatus Chloroploca asiatica]|uniref:histidine kinase n=1 Tax=Candidatus Chloroploca asiatica TaxID=1506545 RepID=A0A2H3KZE6_9CHLR|nr:GAF domain-containing protein [Candidatus Chloroploca asiatica]PDW01072.1 histidine kinase [Candidatus Chloroploca asiatica]